jgi:hypothetical protein
VSARSFDPRQPIARPPAPGRPALAPVWGSAELDRFEHAGHGVVGREPPAISADALLDASAELLDALRASGCEELHLHFETLGGPADSRALRLAGLLARLRGHGFRIHGTFILGWDHDDLGCFERLVEWVEVQRLVTVDLRLWTPDPGSSLVRSLAREDRIRHRALERWDGAHVVVAPNQMSAQTLYRGWAWARRRLGSLASIWRRRPPRWREQPRYLAAVLAAVFARLRPPARPPTRPLRQDRGLALLPSVR